MTKAILQYLEMWQNLGIDQIYETPGQSTEQKRQQLLRKQGDYSNCQLCSLWKGRIKFVYGEGNPDAIVMVIGEGPGEQENLQGRPFVGKAGQLLDKMLEAIQIQRPDAYIANIVKCRPPGNRNPEQGERISCLPYLLEQIDIIKPRCFLLMGLVAAQTLLESNHPMHVLRMENHTLWGRPAFVTYHPSALLRNPEWKKPAWEDLQKFQRVYEGFLALPTP